MRTTALWVAVVFIGMMVSCAALAWAEPTSEMDMLKAQQSLLEKNGPKKKRAVKPPPLDLSINQLPPSALTLPGGNEQREADGRPYRPARLGTEGLRVGDFHIRVWMLFGTDSTLDDANSRERAKRDELDELEFRKNGLIHVDPLTQLFRNRLRANAGGNEVGLQIVSGIHRLLQNSFYLPPRWQTTLPNLMPKLTPN